MKKNTPTYNHIPDIDIIDLEVDGSTEIEQASENDSTRNTESRDNLSPEETPAKDKKKFKLPPYINMHTILLATFVIFVVCLIIKFSNWGIYIDQSQIAGDTTGYLDVLDSILPLMDEEGNVIKGTKSDNIVVFGNAPFADDRDSKDNLANLIADASGAKVYNCSISNSYLASRWPHFDSAEKPMDAYCFYWLSVLACTGANIGYYESAAEVLGDATPPEAAEVVEILTTLDFNEVDTIAIMYDATDYLMGHEMYDDANPTNIRYFTGNLEAGIELFQRTFPHIRIIVMSPTYAFALDENGEYVSSDIYRYGGMDVLSTYVIKQCESCASRSVSFIDNLYGTITEDNASSYLTDHLHLNTEGRKLVTERFMHVLNYYNK